MDKVLMAEVNISEGTNLELVEQISRFSKIDYYKCANDYKLKNRQFDDGNAARKSAEWIVNQL